MHRVIASTVVQSEACLCLDALSFARSPTIVPTWRMYFIHLLTTSGFPRWSWSLKLLLPSAHKKYLSTKQGACTGWAHHGAAPSLSESGFGRRRQWEWQRRSNTGVLLRCGGALELAPRDRADTYPGKSYLRPAVVRSVDASKGRREAQEREP